MIIRMQARRGVLTKDKVHDGSQKRAQMILSRTIIAHSGSFQTVHSSDAGAATKRGGIKAITVRFPGRGIQSSGGSYLAQNKDQLKPNNQREGGIGNQNDSRTVVEPNTE